MTINKFNCFSKKKAEEKDFKDIETVYNYHPCLAGRPADAKQQIAQLYDEFGIRIIWDMIPTAMCYKKVVEAQNYLDKLKKELEGKIYP